MNWEQLEIDFKQKQPITFSDMRLLLTEELDTEQTYDQQVSATAGVMLITMGDSVIMINYTEHNLGWLMRTTLADYNIEKVRVFFVNTQRSKRVYFKLIHGDIMHMVVED